MKTINGKVENVQFSSSIKTLGSGGNSQQKTVHTAQFNINGQSVSYKSNNKPHLVEGDEITAAVSMRFIVKEFHNHTQNYSTIIAWVIWVAFYFFLVLGFVYWFYIYEKMPSIDLYKEYTFAFALGCMVIFACLLALFLGIQRTRFKSKLENCGK